MAKSKDERFKEYVKQHYDIDYLIKTDKTEFIERSGYPKELDAVIGLITRNFQKLEDTVSSCIINLLGTEQEIGEIMTSELSFKTKLNLLIALYHHLKTNLDFNLFGGRKDEDFKELIKVLNKSNDLRNQIIHSTIDQDYTTGKITRNKVSTKTRGLQRIKEEIDIPYLYNIADLYIFFGWHLKESMPLEMWDKIKTW